MSWRRHQPAWQRRRRAGRQAGRLDRVWRNGEGIRTPFFKSLFLFFLLQSSNQIRHFSFYRWQPTRKGATTLEVKTSRGRCSRQTRRRSRVEDIQPLEASTSAELRWRAAQMTVEPWAVSFFLISFFIQTPSTTIACTWEVVLHASPFLFNVALIPVLLQ